MDYSNLAQKFTAPKPEQLDRLMAEYQILRLLESRQRSAIYVARDIQTRQKVAIKILPKRYTTDNAFLEHFEKRMQALMLVDNPHIARILNYGIVDGMIFLAMDYIRGRRLSDLVTEHRINQAKVAVLVSKCASALSALHSELIVHRRLSPENILINESAEPVIIGFALDRPIKSGPALLQDNFVSPYRAPELNDKQAPVTQRADIYSLGVILYEMVCGQLPTRPYSSATKLGASARLDDIIRKAVDPVPSKRYANTKIMRKELEKFREHLAVESQAAILKITTSRHQTVAAVAEHKSSSVSTYSAPTPTVPQPRPRPRRTSNAAIARPVSRQIRRSASYYPSANESVFSPGIIALIGLIVAVLVIAILANNRTPAPQAQNSPPPNSGILTAPVNAVPQAQPVVAPYTQQRKRHERPDFRTKKGPWEPLERTE
ncbi:serine/threonine protein kinase [Persicirhabdus sediminis]|uniref:non-specific serine/threonine protein kinase n=1 Tax=Persicirhabdus sediminis TaxID=454144 RepID=A0A8J7MCG8_9BACT|nr:serine/threonine-protein kinase [Persicirhabdus sediminis]MBK1790568.1 serine/threonine protein kinase [Persicirhabdus sediminis]